jgi:hypothetical protein
MWIPILKSYEKIILGKFRLLLQFARLDNPNFNKVAVSF